MVLTPKVLTCSLNEFNSSVSKVKYKNKLNIFKMFKILNSFWDKYLQDKTNATGIKLYMYLYPYEEATDCQRITIPNGTNIMVDKTINNLICFL